MAPESLAPGAVIGGRFQVEAPLGHGGLGDLYQATDTKSGKAVAIRLLPRDLTRSEAVMDQLRAQVKTASALAHKNIARVYGMGKEGGLRYIAMELVEGQSLRTLLERKRRAGKTFTLKGAYNVIAHVCNALHHCHQTMIHGLPGPGAILVNTAGRVKVAEFGVVRALAPQSASVNRLGDAYCLAPEMHVDPATAGATADVYSLGVVLHELIAGAPPSQPPEPLSALVAGIPAAVEDVVWACLQPDPSGRYPDAQQLKAAFYAAIEAANEAPATARANPPHPAPDPPPAAAPGAMPGPSEPSAKAMAQRNPFEIKASAAAPAPKPQRAAPQPARQVSIEDMLAEADRDTDERWLIQKDRLDFGPFAMGQLKRALYKGEFTGDDMLVDQETGQRCPVRQHSSMLEFMRHLDRHLAARNAQQADIAHRAQARKRRNVLLMVTVFGVLVLAAGGVVAAYLLTRDPEIREKIVYREKEGVSGLKGLDIQWKAEPPEQKKKRRALARRRRRHRKKGAKGDPSVLRLGDATKAGGDALLSQKAIQQVMNKNVRRLTPCVLKAWRRDRSLRRVSIDFGVQGNGRVKYVKVNGQSTGSFHACLTAKMRSLRFPTFDGALTRASFSMNLK